MKLSVYIQLILLLSVCGIVSAKRGKRGEFYVQQPQFIPNFSTRANYDQHTNRIYTPIYESSTPGPFKTIYSQPVVTPVTPRYTPSVSYVTPSSSYDDTNYLSITERPKYVIENPGSINNGIKYVTPSSSVYTPSVSTSYVAPVDQNQFSYVGSHGTSDYSAYNYAPGFYNYQYDVKAPEYGVDFGQFEVQEGDVRRGRYYVLLPDGRRQVVDYTADSTGYHPRIHYEFVGNGFDNDFGLHYK